MPEAAIQYVLEAPVRKRTAKPKVSRRDQILEKLRGMMPQLRGRYGVRSLALFGSFARGEERGSSDLDLLVEFDDRPLTLLEFVALEQELSDLLGVRVDLVEKTALRPRIGQRILSEAVPV